MELKTYIALRKSIAHWQEMAINGWKNQQPSAEQCALCGLFCVEDQRPQTLCDGCPVKERTGKKYCYDTPFSEAFHAFETENEESFLIEAKNELDFLTSLLPDEPLETLLWKSIAESYERVNTPAREYKDIKISEGGFFKSIEYFVSINYITSQELAERMRTRLYSVENFFEIDYQSKALEFAEQARMEYLYPQEK